MKNILSRFLVSQIIVMLCLSSISVLNVRAEQKTIVVPDDFSTIQAAINSASDGDTIFVKEGIYNEGLELNKSLSLIGENKETTIIDGSKADIFAVIIFSNWVNVSGFTIRNAPEKGIELWHVKNCKISGNIITNSINGVSLVQSFHNIIEANIVSSNKYSGIRISGSAYEPNYNIINHNEIENNDVGLDFFQGWNNAVYRNNIVNNRWSLNLDDSSNNYFIENNVTNPTITLRFTFARNNTFWHNNFGGKIQFLDRGWLLPPWIANSSINFWDIDREGNYWSDLSGIDNNQDGIWDSPYVIYGNNTDNYPLIEPAHVSEMVIPEFLSFPTPIPDVSPTPTPLPPIRFYNPYLILFGSTLLLIALGILAYLKKYRK